MSRRLVSLTIANLDDIGAACAACPHWGLGTGAQAGPEWIRDTLDQWGSCGQLLYVDGRAAGHLLYAPPAFVPRSMGFPTSPVSNDAVLLMTGQLAAPYRGAGLGKVLVQGVVRDIAQRGIKAIEAFGVTNPGAVPHRDQPCLLPANFLEAVGFRTVRPHSAVPRLRLEIRSTLSWRADMESAFDRLLASIQTPAVAR
ncbi:GNAT family N-acetyltransferase [Jatrophihabitans sp.]|uniref:GNAT family N-acetyltransferase n=1 Tax=Jatrophihabitans sp. TaxID=1932789 RepID=UPI0030C687EC|nr:hypothetical protein [Jatrophihabitans sp.]